MANSGNSKVTKYPKNINNINIGMVFFAVMAIYIIISVITYFRRDHIVGYEVNQIVHRGDTRWSILVAPDSSSW